MTQDQVVTFRLYVTGDAPNSLLARANLAQFCSSHLPVGHEVEVVDLLRHPERALTDGIFMTPTLVKLTPLPQARFIGSLSDPTPIAASLGLELL